MLRSKADRLERELWEAQQKLRGSGASGGPPSGRSAGNPLAEYQLSEQAKQLEQLNQQLAFREQEVCWCSRQHVLAEWDMITVAQSSLSSCLQWGEAGCCAFLWCQCC